MNLKNIFNNLVKFELSEDFNSKVLKSIDKRKKAIVFYYSFLYGILLCGSILTLIISIYQIEYAFGESFLIILIAFILFSFVTYQIRKLWKNTNLY
jgi:glucan phosphoethanolaminetransferase (alkaline phosphatase superfamily)